MPVEKKRDRTPNLGADLKGFSAGRTAGRRHDVPSTSLKRAFTAGLGHTYSGLLWLSVLAFGRPFSANSTVIITGVARLAPVKLPH